MHQIKLSDQCVVVVHIQGTAIVIEVLVIIIACQISDQLILSIEKPGKHEFNLTCVCMW